MDGTKTLWPVLHLIGDNAKRFGKIKQPWYILLKKDEIGEHARFCCNPIKNGPILRAEAIDLETNQRLLSEIRLTWMKQPRSGIQ